MILRALREVKLYRAIAEDPPIVSLAASAFTFRLTTLGKAVSGRWWCRGARGPRVLRVRFVSFSVQTLLYDG